MIITIKNKPVLNLPSLLRIALKSIYDTKNLTNQEEDFMQKSIVNWQKHLQLQRDIGRFGIVQKENQITLEYIGNLLYQNSMGKMEDRKVTFANHNIDYRKFYRLPEAYKPEDFVKAQEALEEHKRTNPEDYE